VINLDGTISDPNGAWRGPPKISEDSEALALALRLGLEECERLRAECQALQDRVAYHDKLLWDAGFREGFL